MPRYIIQSREKFMALLERASTKADVRIEAHNLLTDIEKELK